MQTDRARGSRGDCMHGHWCGKQRESGEPTEVCGSPEERVAVPVPASARIPDLVSLRRGGPCHGFPPSWLMLAQDGFYFLQPKNHMEKHTSISGVLSGDLDVRRLCFQPP